MRIDSLHNINHTNYRYNFCKKQSEMSFYGAKEDFGKYLKDLYIKQPNFEQINELTKKGILDNFRIALDDILCSKNLLGKGCKSAVYKVDDSFVLKIRKNLLNIEGEDIPNNIDIEDNVFKDLKTYYGVDLIKFGEDISIKKNAGVHIPVGVPFSHSNGLETFRERNRYYLENYLPMFAKVKQTSYDDIAHDFAILNKLETKDHRKYEFDSVNPGNIVLADDKLYMVDEMSVVSCHNPNTIGKLIEIFLYKSSVFKIVESYQNRINEAREILRKIIIAGEKANLPYITREMDERIFNTIVKTTSIDKFPKEFVDDLYEIRMENPNIDDRIPKINKYLDESFINLNPINR